MKQFRELSDERLLTGCIYCGGVPETRDHVPSRVLLDDPLPANLPVVPACNTCNQSFSKDEEYVACLLEVIRTGSPSPAPQMRPKIRSILEQRPSLTARLRSAMRVSEEDLLWVPEDERVAHVVLKLARGHAAYELCEAQLNPPDRIETIPLSFLSDGQRVEFERPATARIWPEVGSRAMQRLAVEDWPDARQRWIVVQPARYRYLTSIEYGVTVCIILSEYLACEVHWS